MEFPVASIDLKNAFNRFQYAEITDGAEPGTPSRMDAENIRFRDGRIACLRTWNAAEPTLGNILALHGFTDYSGSFDAIGPQLNDIGFNVFAYDQRGFGDEKSRALPAHKDHLLNDVVDAIRILKRECDPALPLYLLGESMGGAVAVSAARKHPKLGVDGLILASPAVWTGHAPRFAYRTVINTLATLMPGLKVRLGRTTGEDLINATEFRLTHDPNIQRTVSLELVKQLVSIVDDASRLGGKIEIPSLFLYGDGDSIIDLAPIERASQALFSQADLKTFNGAPHLLLHWRKAGQVFTNIRDWSSDLAMARTRRCGERLWHFLNNKLKA